MLSARVAGLGEGPDLRALEAPRNVSVRSKAEQLPDAADMWLVQTVHRHFAADPVQFENFAAEMWMQSDPHVASIEVTRPSRDGGRDAIGEYRLGPGTDPIRLEFALEAKCYDPDGGGIGVRLVSRLISRIKHREFGVFVTTAFIARQAYQEVREDGHPIVFLCGRDIAALLKRMGMTDSKKLDDYLTVSFPLTRAADERSDIVEPGVDTTVEATHDHDKDCSGSLDVRVSSARSGNRAGADSV